MTIRVRAKVNKDLIQLDTCYENGLGPGGTDHVVTELINLKEKTVREALIKAGWTPPKED